MSNKKSFVRPITLLLSSLMVMSFTPIASASDIVQTIRRIKSGNEFRVVFNKVNGKFNDSGWRGNSDPMGTLKAGYSYSVTYFRNQYVTRGFNEAKQSTMSAAYTNADPDEGLISLWGRQYSFDGKGNVYDPDYGIVGTLYF